MVVTLWHWSMNNIICLENWKESVSMDTDRGTCWYKTKFDVCSFTPMFMYSYCTLNNNNFAIAKSYLRCGYEIWSSQSKKNGLFYFFDFVLFFVASGYKQNEQKLNKGQKDIDVLCSVAAAASGNNTQREKSYFFLWSNGNITETRTWLLTNAREKNVGKGKKIRRGIHKWPNFKWQLCGLTEVAGNVVGIENDAKVGPQLNY